MSFIFNFRLNLPKTNELNAAVTRLLPYFSLSSLLVLDEKGKKGKLEKIIQKNIVMVCNGGWNGM